MNWTYLPLFIMVVELFFLKQMNANTTHHINNKNNNIFLTNMVIHIKNICKLYIWVYIVHQLFGIVQWYLNTQEVEVFLGRYSYQVRNISVLIHLIQYLALPWKMYHYGILKFKIPIEFMKVDITVSLISMKSNCWNHFWYFTVTNYH